jgi:hypothetical protein
MALVCMNYTSTYLFLKVNHTASTKLTNYQ